VYKQGRPKGGGSCAPCLMRVIRGKGQREGAYLLRTPGVPHLCAEAGTMQCQGEGVCLHPPVCMHLPARGEGAASG
jgi:hypothetical protein